MAEHLESQLGVAASGEHWDVNGYRLWQSTDPDIILYCALALTLSKDSGTGRYQAATNVFRTYQDGAYAVTGGSAQMTVSAGLELSLPVLAELRETWRTALQKGGYRGSANPQFQPLPIRNSQLRATLPVASGKLIGGGISAPGSTSSQAVLQFELTAPGASEWSNGVNQKTAVKGSVTFSYERLQMLPPVTANVTFKGLKAFTYFSRVFQRMPNGNIGGTESDIRSAWSELMEQGALVVDFGNSVNRDAQQDELINTFAEQARQHLFDVLFAPVVEPDDDDSSEPRYFLRWRQRTEATDFRFTLSCDSWNWLKETIETGLTNLLSLLDSSYVGSIYTQVSIPCSVTVEPDPLLSTVGVSLTFTEGHRPEAPVFGKDGGSAQYTITSTQPDMVGVSYDARVTFSPSQWPVLNVKGAAKVKEGGSRILLKPGSWVRKHTLYAYFRQGNRILKSSEVSKDDYLVLNITRQLSSKTLRESARLTAQAPVQFRYPVEPQGTSGVTKLSVMGFVGGKPVRSSELTVSPDEGDVFILADSNGVQLVSKNAVMPEDDPLAQRLLKNGARPAVDLGAGA